MKKILILGGDSDFNLGDTAILHALCASLHRTDPAVAITITSRKHCPKPPPGVVQVLRRGLHHGVAHLRAAARQDLVIVGGGGLFQDDDSRIKMPYWASRIGLLRLAQPNIVAHAVGAGPLGQPESQAAARLACGWLRSVSVRDSFAQQALQACTPRKVSVVPDPAFMLAPAPPEKAAELLKSLGLTPGRPLIGVALRRWFHRRGGFVPHRIRAALRLDRQAGETEMSELLDDLAVAVRGVARELEASVLMLPTYNVGHEADVTVCSALASRLAGIEVRTALIDDPALYKAVTGQLALLLSARMHPLILAAGMGTPVVGMAYNGKFAGVFDLLEIPDQLVWLDEFRTGSQAGKLQRLALNAVRQPVDLAQRAARLATQCHEATAALIGAAAATAA